MQPASKLGEARARSAALVEDRLRHIVHAVGGQDVKTNGEELWFTVEAGDVVEVRLGPDLNTRCYDRSENFAISYGGRPNEPAPASFRGVVNRIKTVDDSRIADAAAVFEVAASRVARGTPQEAATSIEDPAPYTAVRWERRRTRDLNVVFLDFCARLIGKPGQALPPLHWGFWPTDTPAAGGEPADYDPFEAFSENLLAHVPAGVTRIMDIGCGLGVNTRLLAARGKRVTAVSPVAHHCAAIEAAKLPGVEVRCERFEEMTPEEQHDLLLFSESVNHFPLGDEFLDHCGRFLSESGYILLADDFTEERALRIERQRGFRLLCSVDISANVAPTAQWWARQKRVVAASRTALMAILELHDPPLAARASEILDNLDSSELKALFAEQESIPTSKGRYMIYLLQRLVA